MVRESHPAIVDAETFDKVQEEMTKRSRVVHHEDGSVRINSSKYNGKYLLGNLLVCSDCGASYRRRTERGKVLWRCATRIEKGKDKCSLSPTIKEAWLREQLSALICGGSYDESTVKNKVSKIDVYDRYILVNEYEGANTKICLR